VSKEGCQQSTLVTSEGPTEFQNKWQQKYNNKGKWVKQEGL
jgi:hypothetical protein